MATDYKPRAKKTRRKKKAGKTVTPGWVWLSGGLLGGLLLGFGGYALLSVWHKPAGTRPVPAQAAPKSTAADSEAIEDDTPRYDFYTLLPKMEVVIPDSEIEAAERALPKRKKPLAYVLQAGSFREYGEADAQKASLALIGIEADIENVVINNNEQWYRVRMGPYADMDSVRAIRRQLKKNNINYVLLQINKQ